MTDDKKPAQQRIVWNDANMRATFANVVNVSATSEEFSLLFGTNRSWHGEGPEVRVDLSDRILLTPHAAKRLIALLNRAMQSYEAQNGPVKVQPGPGGAV